MDDQHRSADHLVPDLHQDRYTLHEAATLLSMNVDVLRHAVQAGELKAERIGHEIVSIHRDDLLAWLKRSGPGV